MSYTFAKVTINWPGNDSIALLEPVRNAYRRKTMYRSVNIKEPLH